MSHTSVFARWRANVLKRISINTEICSEKLLHFEGGLYMQKHTADSVRQMAKNEK